MLVWRQVPAAANEGKQSEKKEREARGNVEIMWRTRGVLVDGHVAWQMFSQSCSCSERVWSWEHVLAIEASAGPSRHVRIWV